jgi:DNA-binding LacI/PurR family transcriptional regulator
MANLKDIASKVGVSVRTVNRVLKDNGYVRAEVRTKVLAAANELGYRPNRAAQALRQKTSFEITVLLWSIDEMHIAKVAGLEQRFRKEGYWVSLIMGQSLSEQDHDTHIIDEVLSRRPAGIVLLGDAIKQYPFHMAQLQKFNSITVVMGGDVIANDSVIIDRQQGVYESIHYLAKKGNQHIAYLFFSTSDHVHNAERLNATRLNGYYKALAELAMKPTIVKGAPNIDQFESGRLVAKDIISDPHPPDAIQAYTDKMALGLLAGFNEIGVRVPNDIAIVGFDDRSAAALSSPPLTTVAQPNWEVGTQTAELLLSKIRGDSPPNEGWIRILPTRLVIRESA